MKFYSYAIQGQAPVTLDKASPAFLKNILIDICQGNVTYDGDENEEAFIEQINIMLVARSIGE